jgi:hypothetical protein
VQVCDVAEPDQGFGIGSDSSEVEPVGDPVGPSCATGGDNRPDPWVPERFVEVFEPIIVGAGHVAPLVDSMAGDLSPKIPAFKDLQAPVDGSPIWVAGW